MAPGRALPIGPISPQTYLLAERERPISIQRKAIAATLRNKGGRANTSIRRTGVLSAPSILIGAESPSDINHDGVSLFNQAIQGATALPQVRGDYCADRRSIAYQKKIERSRMKAPIQSSAIGINGLTFKVSCDSSVAIAPAK